MRFPLLLLIAWLSVSGLSAQTSLTPAQRDQLRTYQDTLVVLGDILLTDTVPENRFAATKKLIQTLVTALDTPHSFEYAFPEVRTISIQYPQDSSSRIFTWQLYVDKDDYRYFGAIQRAGKELTLIPLADRSEGIGGRELETIQLSPERWYGALYYKIRQFDTPEGRKYLLFVFDGYQFFDKRKLVDVLQFDEVGKATFGAPVFQPANLQTPARSRLLLEYGAEASVRLNFDENLDVVIHSHLIPMGNPHTGFPSQVPDGSFVGYRLQDGRWQEVPKMFDTVLRDGEAPRETPVLDREKGRNVGGEEIRPASKKSKKRRRKE